MKKIKNFISSVSRRISIKWNVFFSFIAITALLLGILWVLQIVMLDKIYSYIKTENLKKDVETIISSLSDDNYIETLDEFTRVNELSIMIVDEKFNIHHSKIAMPMSKLSDLRSQLTSGEKYEISVIFDDVVNAPGGAASSVYVTFGGGLRRWTKENFNYGFSQKPEKQEKLEDFEEKKNELLGAIHRHTPPSRSLVYSKMITLSDGNTGLIMIESLLTPVSATVETLSSIFGIVAVVMIILSLIIALCVSTFITRPIRKINNTAKQLAKGDYSVKFKGDSYKEIAQLNDTLNVTAVELSRVENLRRELLANVSHDLRTPLTMIIGYSEVMRDIPGENTPENIQVIIDESARLSSLVNDLLDNSKLQAGTMPFKKDTYNLTDSIIGIVSRYEKMVSAEGFNFHFDYDDNVYINADENRISQVICNLLNNAINYSGSEKKVVIRQIKNGKRIRIEVIDTGVGIAKEDLPYIWDRYYKVDKTHKRGQIGTGLGLSIVKSLLELHNADYGVTSTLGEGSVFWFEVVAE